MLAKIVPYPKTTFVFCYHRVIPTDLVISQCVHKTLYVTPETFERHIKWMKEVGEIVSYDRLWEKGPGPRFVITLDDGWKDNYSYAFPILKKYNVPALIFISTSNIDQGKLFWFAEIGMLIKQSHKNPDDVSSTLQKMTSEAMKMLDVKDSTFINHEWSPKNKLYILDRFIECLKALPPAERDRLIDILYTSLGIPQSLSENFLLSWNDICSMMENGVSFGSHTHMHSILDKMDTDYIDKELSISKKILENRLCRKINTFSYPNGRFRNKLIQPSLRKYGYEFAFTLERSPVLSDTNPFLIPRCLVYESIASDLIKYYWRLIIKHHGKEGFKKVKKVLANTKLVKTMPAENCS